MRIVFYLVLCYLSFFLFLSLHSEKKLLINFQKPTQKMTRNNYMNSLESKWHIQKLRRREPFIEETNYRPFHVREHFFFSPIAFIWFVCCVFFSICHRKLFSHAKHVCGNFYISDFHLIIKRFFPIALFVCLSIPISFVV